MNQAVTVTGMILSAAPVGDYDKRVVILTKERGKISAFARGARRPNSSLVGVTTPFAFGEMTLYEGKSSYNLVQADISNYFSELRTDMEGAYYGFYFMEFADYYTKENNDEREMLKLLYQSLRVLVRKTIPYELIRYIFELKSISINGEAPEVFACVSCGSTEELEVFSESGQGMLCSECCHEVKDGKRLHPSTVYAMQYIISSSIEKLYTFTVSAQVQKELKQLMKQYIRHHIDKNFKSLEVLEVCIR